MEQSLEDIGVKTDGLMEPATNAVFIMQSGAQVGVSTPLSPEDVMALWNARGSTLKIPAGGDHSYVVIKKRHVDCLHTFPAQKK